MKNLFDLTSKIGVITGGAGMLGLQHARALLQQGCAIKLWDIDAKGLELNLEKLRMEFPNSNIEINEVNITFESEVATAVNSLELSFAPVEILINNAALNPKFEKNSEYPPMQFENYSLDLWNAEISVGLTGAMLCSKYLGSYMARRGRGVILNIASDLSVIAPDQRLYEDTTVRNQPQFKKPVSYSVVKSGIAGLTRYLSTYWADQGIRANSLSPGGIFSDQDPEFVRRLESRIPMGRMANPDEYVGAIQFLCSDASAYLNGQNIVIDGGRSSW